DLLIGGAGNDTLDGGAGLDTAWFDGNRGNYAVTKAGGSIVVVTDTRAGSPDGTDTITNVERFEVNGVTQSLAAFTPSNFNGDQKSDVLYYDFVKDTPVAYLQDSLTFNTAVTIGPDNGQAWQAVASGDFNGDGNADILWRHTSGLVVAYLMNGTAITSAEVV